MTNLSEIVFKKVCRTCLSSSQDMTPLYGASSSSTFSFADILMKFTPLKFFGYDGLPRHICHNCIEDLNRSYTFQLKCIESDTILRRDIEKDVLSRERSIFTESILSDPHVSIEMEDIKIEPPINHVKINQNTATPNKSLNQNTVCSIVDNNLKGKLNETNNLNDCEIDMNKTNIPSESSETNSKSQNNNLTNDVTPPRKKFLCNLCPRTYYNIKNLNIHIQNHAGSTFVCSVCDITFKTNRALVRHHIFEHAPENPEFKENPISKDAGLQCSNISEMQKDLNQELDLINPEGDNDIIIRPSMNQVEIIQDSVNHIKSFNGINDCLIIEDNSKVKNNIGTHNSDDSKIEMNKTLDIPSESSQSNSRSLNQINVTNDAQSSKGEMLSCNICLKTFTQKCLLTAHMLDHTREKRFMCSVCNCTFAKSRKLTRHRKRVHAPDKPEIGTKSEDNPIRKLARLQCLNNVPATLQKIPLLIPETQTVLHQEAHLVNQDINVDVNIKIEESNNDSNDIMKEIYVPEESLNSQLTYTEMQEDLNQTLDLEQHKAEFDDKMEDDQIKDNANAKHNIDTYNSHDSKMEVNNTSKDPSETITALSENNKLTDGIQPQTTVYKYSCWICSKRFNQRKRLTVHIMNVHRGEKPFNCAVCNTWFHTKDDLTSHRLTHPVKPYVCYVCSSAFSDKPQCLIHLQNIHNISDNFWSFVLIT